MNDLVTTNNSLQINSNININMQELVSVGLAKMETRFTKKIKNLTTDVERLRKDKIECHQEVDNINKSLVPESLKRAKEFLVTLGVDKGTPMVKNNFSTPLLKNQFMLGIDNSITIVNGYRQNFMLLKQIIINATEEQNELLNQSEEINKTIEKKNTLIVKYRRRMGNINKLERQIKARIVEKQLMKTADGEELLNSFMNSFETDIENME